MLNGGGEGGEEVGLFYSNQIWETFIFYFFMEMAKKTAHVATMKRLLLHPLIAVKSLEYCILTSCEFKITFWFPP